MSNLSSFKTLNCNDDSATGWWKTRSYTLEFKKMFWKLFRSVEGRYKLLSIVNIINTAKAIIG